VNHASRTCATIRCLLETSDTDIGQLFFTQPNPTHNVLYVEPTQPMLYHGSEFNLPFKYKTEKRLCKNEDERIKERCRRRKHLTREANQYIHVKSSTNNCTRPYIPSHYITAVQQAFPVGLIQLMFCFEHTSNHYTNLRRRLYRLVPSSKSVGSEHNT